MAKEPREERITVGGTTVHMLVGGQGAPLLVLHGAGGPNGWRRWHGALAEQFTVYVPSHPGYGLSDSADWMESPRDMARFYLWFMDVVGLQRPHLVGLSLGGYIAAELAAMHPGAIDRLVLVGAAGLKPEHGEILDIFYYPVDQLRGFSFHDPAQVPEWEELHGQPPTPEQEDLAMRAREMSARLIWKPYAHNPRLPHFLPRVTNETLIVWGRQDSIVPVACGEQYQRLLPNARLAVLENCGHSPHLERPDEFVGLLREFLSEACAATTAQAEARQ